VSEGFEGEFDYTMLLLDFSTATRAYDWEVSREYKEMEPYRLEGSKGPRVIYGEEEEFEAS